MVLGCSGDESARARRRWATSLLTIGALVVGCRKAPRAATEPQSLAPLDDVAIVGCASWASAATRVCRLEAARRLSVVLPSGATSIEIGVDGAALESTARGREGARVADVTVPEGASTLTVVATIDGVRRRAVQRVERAPLPSVALATARRLRGEGKLDEALAAVTSREAEPNVEANERADLVALRGRLLLAKGAASEAAATLSTAADRHRALGEISAATLDLSARVFVLLDRLTLLSEARDAIAQMEETARGYPEGRPLVDFDRGMLARAAADTHGALEALSAARRESERIGWTAISRDVTSLAGLVLIEVGRAAEAHEIFRTLDREADPQAPTCARLDVRLNLAWSAIVAREAPHASATWLSDPVPLLEAAEQAYGDACKDDDKRANALVDLARARWLAGDLAGATRTLDRLRSLGPRPTPLVALEAIEISGRVCAARGDVDCARADFTELARRAEGVQPLRQEIAYEALAELAARTRDEAAVGRALDRAESIADRIATTVAFGEGRGAFWATRARLTELRVAWWLRAGDARNALEVARGARSRVVGDALRSARLSRADATTRARWDAAVSAYRRTRDALLADETDDWSRSVAARAAAATRRHEQDVAARAELDAVARALMTSEQSADPIDATAPWFAIVALDARWVLFSIDAGAVVAEAIDASTDPAHLDDAAAIVSAHFAAKIGTKSRVRLLALDLARSIDWHAREVDGAPLLERAVFEYLVEGAPTPAPEADVGLFVGDPTLALPNARAESLALADAVTAKSKRVRLGADATRARVLDDLDHASIFTFSGHGRFSGSDGFDSALRLAGDDRLDLGDVLALSAAPARVILSGCETGLDRSAGGAPGLSLADAFVAMGSSSVVAATRVVDDASTAALMAALARSLATRGRDFAAALRDAQVEVHRAHPEIDVGAFRAFAPLGARVTGRGR